MIFNHQIQSCRLRQIFTGYDILLILYLFILIGIGLLTLDSASISVPSRINDQIRNITITFILMYIIANLHPQKIMRFAVPLYFGGIILLVNVAYFGISHKGAKRWINMGIIIQPSEIMKIATPLMLAWYYQLREGIMRWFDHIIGLILVIIPVVLIARQPDLGTALLVSAAGFFVIYFSGLSFKVITPLFIISIILIGTILISKKYICNPEVNWPFFHNYQKHRICTLVDPTIDPLGKGFHTIQAVIAVGSGGIFGKGWLKGTQSHLEFIPETHTDFIFAVFSEEFGFIGEIILLTLYFLIIVRSLVIAVNSTTLFSRLIASGITMTIFTYTFVNIGMVSGILPVVGVPLPMISYGGTALATLGIANGIILSIARHCQLVKKQY